MAPLLPLFSRENEWNFDNDCDGWCGGSGSSNAAASDDAPQLERGTDYKLIN